MYVPEFTSNNGTPFSLFNLFLEPFDKSLPGLIVFLDLIFNRLPRGCAVLVLHVHQPMENPVYLLLVLLGDFHPGLLKNLLHVPEVAGHNMPPYP